MTEHLADRIRRGEPIPPVLGALLSAATPMVRLGMWWRRLRRPVRVDARVISFGNLTAGGTGKTPAVVERAREELAAGRRVAVLTRGYGTTPSSEPVVVDHGDAVGRAAVVGDEPALIARRAPGVVIVKCADRVAGARAALERGCDTLILDDGFQSVRLARDEDVVVIDATNPFGNGRLLPRGILREPLTALRRATRIIVTRCDQAEGIAGLRDALTRMCPAVPVRTTWHAPSALWRVADGEEQGVTALRGMRVAASCAIGHPEGFFRTLEALGAELVTRTAHPDHAAFEIETVPPGVLAVVTEKDAVRMARPARDVWALAVELRDWPGS